MKNKLLMSVCFLFPLLLFSQSKNIDSLHKIISEKKLHDTIVAEAYTELSWQYKTMNDYDKALEIAEKGAEFALEKKLNHQYNMLLLAHAQLFELKGNPILALEYCNKIIKFATPQNDDKALARAYFQLGYIYASIGDITNSAKYYRISLPLNKKIGNKRSVAGLLNNLGLHYLDIKNYEESKSLIKQAIEINTEIKNDLWLGYNYVNLGRIYTETDSLKLAEEYLKKSQEIFTQLKDNYGMANSILVFTEVYKKQNKPYEAEKMHLEAIRLFEEIKDYSEIAMSKNAMAKFYTQSNQTDKALKYANEAIEIAKQINALKILCEIKFTLYEIYNKNANYKKALEYYTEYVRLNDSLIGQEKKIEFNNSEIRYQYEQKMLTDSIKRSEQEIQNELIRKNEAEKQKAINLAYMGGFVLIFIIMLFLYKGYKDKKKSAEAIAIEKNNVELQKSIIEEKNNEIIDSIRYAKRIQNAILPNEDFINEHLPESFILFMPKDIVSGDFYWVEKKNNNILFSVVDCTGHGVPGAFVSLVARNELNRCVNELNIEQPSIILDTLTQQIERTFDSKNEDVQDGMDIALCSINFKNNKLQYAGANNPLWIFRKNNTNYEFLELKADKQPIGKYHDRKKYTNHQIDLLTGDTIYLFSDGFADQFGGENGKKLKYSRMKELLFSIQSKSMHEQYNYLSNEFNRWKGEIEQVDDVCVLGVKI